MRVLMLSLDRGLFGQGSSGDVLERHQAYADRVGHLDIIVFASGTYQSTYRGTYQNLRIFPTKSSKHQHFAKAVTLAKTLARKNQYDLLVTQDFASPAGVEIKRSLKIPWIITIHGMFFSSEWLGYNPVNWYLFYRIKKAISGADGFRVNNAIIQKRLLDWQIDKPILVQPTAIDLSKFSVETGEKRVHNRILFVGRLSPEKNVSMLISVFKMITGDLELMIVGDGPERAKLEKLSEDDKRIKFLGNKKYEELPDIFQSSRIFVLPSNTETFGQVLMQAAAAGCALIATKTTGAKSILTENEAMLVEVGDAKGLGEAIEKLALDDDLRNRLIQNARQLVKKYDREASITRLTDFWMKIARS